MRLFLLLATLLTACDPFAAAQKEDSVEAWETFLEENPTSPWKPQAEDRLQVLLFEQAKTQGTLPAYDKWLERFPSSPLRDEVMAARESSLFRWAEDQDTVESWSVFLREYPQSRRKGAAERGQRVATHRDHITIEDPRASRTNLAEDPEGPLNGWLLEADIANTSDTPMRTVVLAPESPDPLTDIVWPVAAARWSMPITDEQRRPLGAGESRTWTWTTDAMDEDWDGTFTLGLADIEP